MSARVVIVVAVTALIVCRTPAHALTSSELGCQSTIGREAARFVATTHEVAVRCENAIVNGSTCDADQRDRAVARARARLARQLANACGRITLENLGFPGSCSDASGGGFSVDDLVACLDGSHTAAVDMAVMTEYPDPQAQSNQSAARCQREIGSQGQSFIERKLRARARCLELQLKGKTPSGVDCRAELPPGTGDRRTDRRITEAAENLADQLGRACNGVTLEILGFPGSCPDPNGGAFTVQDLQQCIHDTHEQKADALIAIEYPPSGGTPATPTPAASVAPTATDTSVPAATPTATAPVETATSTSGETPTVTSSANETPVPTLTEAATVTPIETPTATSVETPTGAPVETPTGVATVEPTPVLTATSTPTTTALATEEPTPGETPTGGATIAATPTDVPTDVATATFAATATPTPTFISSTPSATITLPLPTVSLTLPLPSPTVTGAPGATATETSGASATPTDVATATVGGPTPTDVATATGAGPTSTANGTAAPTTTGGGTPGATASASPTLTPGGPCVLPTPIPEVLSFVAKPGIDLDTGWTGQSHDLPGVDDGSLAAAAVSNCDLDLQSATCGQCDLNGPVLFPGPSKNCRCYNLTNRDASTLAVCDPEMPSTCTSPETCECFYGPPLPLSSGAISVCVVNRYTAPITGTTNIADAGPHAGEGDSRIKLEASVHNGPTVDQPCPRCIGDPTPRDGVTGGTCNEGPKVNMACDVSGTNVFFGEVSFDCPPSRSANIGNLNITFNHATTGTSSLATAGVKCTASNATSQECMCDTCASAAAEPCNSNADCTGGATCGGKRCVGGPKAGTPCTSTSECGGAGSCSRPGQATAPNQCDDGVCSPDATDPGSPNDGSCDGGPFDNFCSLESFRGCLDDTDCNPPPSGNCGSCATGQVCGGGFRNCFLNPIVRTGMPGTQMAVIASTFCVPQTSSSAVNSVGGLPGPGGILQPTRIFRSGAQCGNGTLDAGETCDSPSDASCPGLCLPNCQCPACGDNQVNQPSEQCDGGDDAACPGVCQPNCTCGTGTCGNDMTEFGEECDGADDTACPGACQGDCTCGPFCGNGAVDAGEECDGAASTACPPSACQGDCTCGPFCGNGTIDPGEQCDQTSVGTCPGTCQGDCTCAPFCGNGIREAGELCDPPQDDVCPGDCQSDCTCPAIGTLSFVAKTGADLDTGWTGTSHDFSVQAGSTIPGEIAACDNVTDFDCTFFANVGSFCSGDASSSCTENTQCAVGQTCIINTYGPPLPLSSGGVPVCIVNRFADDVTGTYNLQTGASAIRVPLNSLVHLAADVNRPCPICDCGDADPQTCQIGDAGTCSDNPLRACTVQGTGPFGPTSNDCPPPAASNVSGSGLALAFDPATTATSSFPSNQPCDGSGFQTQMCWCDGQTQPNACLNACDGGTNDAQPCDTDADCLGAPAGACKPLCRQITGAEVGEGECAAGPFDQTCAGAHQVSCTTDAQCPGVGPCQTETRRCFLDPIVREGMAGTTMNVFASTFCIPATTSPAVNNTAGLPGPGAIRFPNDVTSAFCGDNVVNGSEECDGSSAANCPGNCSASCTCNTTCGNGVREFGEQCDTTDSTACPGLCTAPGMAGECTCPPVCGDGFVGPGEQCDPGGPGGTPPPSDAACPGQCLQGTCQCQPPVCGDGMITGTEVCELPQTGCGPLQLCVGCTQCAP